MYLWCRLLPQCTPTLNLLQPSQFNPQLSAKVQLNSAFDFNYTLLAPPGKKVIVHKKPAVRQSWAPHGVDGCYLSPTQEHYRYYTVYISNMANTRIADKVAFFPANIPMPKTPSNDAVLQLTHALQHPLPAGPYAHIGNAQFDALRHLLPQSILTLNLLRQSCLNSKLSAEAQLIGAFDFNKISLASPVTCVIVHEKPSV